MVSLEGIEFNAKPILKRQLAKVWKGLSRKPLPKIKALMLRDDDFNHVIESRRCLEDNMREIDEWGKLLSTRGTDACVFNARKSEDAKYIILIRENPYHSLDEIILHELSHIAKGDL